MTLIRPAGLFIFLLAGSGGLRAQDASRVTGASDAANRQLEQATESLPKKTGEKQSIPSLYDGEAEDIGPQLLLLPAPPHDWFRAMADVQDYYTSNATLSETETWADIAVITARLGVESPGYALGSGKIALSAGYGYQNFLYGELTGRQNHAIAGGVGTIDSLNFQTHTGFVGAEWNAGGWSAGTAVRYSCYIASPTDKTSYQEWAPSAHAGYRFVVTERDFVSIDGDIAYRYSHTMIPSLFAGGLGYDLNDRCDLGLNLTATHVFGERLLLQGGYRLQYSDYTQGGSTVASGAGREDLYNILSVSFGYYFNQNIAVRLFASAEFRESSEDVVADYSNYNAGAGVTVSLAF